MSTKLIKHINELESYLPVMNQLNVKISTVDVAWHIDHSLKVINRIYDVLTKSDPRDYNYQFSLGRLVIFSWGDFPRGVAKSPKVVLPPSVVLKEDLITQLEMARKNISNIDDLPAKAHFEHFSFKMLDRNRTKRFLTVHTGHHVKIIRDIIRSR